MPSTRSPRHLRWAPFAGLLVAACRPEPVIRPPAEARASETGASGSLDPITAMAFGSGKSCAVHASGRVTCRGDGQPIHTLPGITDAEKVVFTGLDVCVRTRSGAVRCKPYADTDAAYNSPFPDEVLQLAAGGGMCALLRMGDVRCGAPPQPSPLTPERDAVELAVSGNIHCVRHRNGSVSCARLDDRTADAVLKLPDLTRARQLALGGHDVCVLLTDDSTRCWGLSPQGPLIATERQQPPLPPFAALAAGDRFRCGMVRGAVTCWGDNASLQLGDPAIPQGGVGTVRDIDDAEALFVGPRQACVRRRDRSTWCWGEDEGALGDGQPARVPLPGEPWHLAGLRQLSAVDDRTCALLADGEITCWGTRSAWTRPTPALAPGPAVAIVSDEQFDCAQLRGGPIACRTVRPPLAPETPHSKQGWWTVPDSERVATFSVSFASIASLGHDGSLRTWNLHKQTWIHDPERIEGIELHVKLGAWFVRMKDGRVRCLGSECPDLHGFTGAVALATTWYSFCALRHDGSLACANEVSRNKLFEVPGRHAAIAGSRSHLCALALDRRRVRCWDGATFQPGEPFPELDVDTPFGDATVELMVPAQAITVGDAHMCATFEGERLTCWGSNKWGQLGNGRAGVRAAPAPYPSS